MNEPHWVSNGELLSEIEEIAERARDLEDEAKKALNPVTDLRLTLVGIAHRIQAMLDSVDRMDKDIE